MSAAVRLFRHRLTDAFWEATSYGHRRNDPRVPQVSAPKRRDRVRRALEAMAGIEASREGRR
jgi:hypothetical protein